jgi:hypothetical protein
MDEEREQLLEACAIAGYEARAKKTGGPKWGYRDADTQRRYREIAVAAIEMYEELTRPAPGTVTVGVETARFIARELRRLADHNQFDDADVADKYRAELDAALAAAAGAGDQ